MSNEQSREEKYPEMAQHVKDAEMINAIEKRFTPTGDMQELADKYVRSLDGYRNYFRDEDGKSWDTAGNEIFRAFISGYTAPHKGEFTREQMEYFAVWMDSTVWYYLPQKNMWAKGSGERITTQQLINLFREKLKEVGEDMQKFLTGK